MKITMPVAITAADAESRIIAGRIVSWNAEGNTSAGRTMFEKDSIKMAKNTKLVLQHDTTSRSESLSALNKMKLASLQNLRSLRQPPVTMHSRKLQQGFVRILALA
jgi:hypothetical protein